MDKKTAKEKVRKVCQNSFDKEKFIDLLKNLLKKYDESKAFHARGYVKEKFKSSTSVIKTYERLGTYTDPQDKKIDLLIAYLQKETSLERARTALRNFVADYLKQRNMKDAALVAFVAPNGEDWRFSFVKMEYKFNHKGEVEGEFTPARKCSFLVGKNENSHTAQSRLWPLLLNDEANPTLTELEETFSVERVTKEFFEKYRDLFLRLKESLVDIVQNNPNVKADFLEKNIDTSDFAKKLLGQIVFLYFLQKKGWFGVERSKEWGFGSKHFLRELFEKKHGDYTYFFNDILEPLFYEALRLERPGDYYSRFNCRIPFLNGGLFDPIGNYDWWNTDILLPNEIFSNDRKIKDDDIGDGILDVFDRYNFTVKEDEPLEKEVAIDPEMLGKVFENLLEVKDRKSKGTYYTPREIVHYMCQESLINYLATELDGKVSKEGIETLIKHGESVVEHDSHIINKGQETKDYSFKLPENIRKHAQLIDEKLEIIRICDPAVGSGAFPVGMMSEIVRTRNALTPYIGKEEERSSYHFKRHAIQNCLYGVDIDPGAVEIAKLRLWLSLIVDEEEREKIQPLPNLDYKIVQGNSLLSVEKDLFNNDLFNKLEKLKPFYFNETSASKKQEYRKQIDDLISKITNGHKDFDFEVYFSEVFHEKEGFDVVIANPPYGAEMSKFELKEIRKNLKITKNTNSAAVFIDYGINCIINSKGTLTFIVPKSLLFSEGWFDLVKAMIGKVSILVDVEKAFERVLLEQVVFLYGNAVKADHYLANKFLDDEFVRSISIPHYLVPKYSAWICDISKAEIQIAEKVTSTQIVYMRDISETKRGASLQKYLKKKGDFPVIRGKDIFKYGIKNIQNFFMSKNLAISKYKISFLCQQKIVSQNVVAHVANPRPHIVIMATIDKNGNLLSVDTVNNTVITDKRFDLKYILALINSRFTSWYAYRFIYCSAIRTMHFDNYYIGKIPIGNLPNREQKPFIDLVDKILAITKDDDYLQNSQNKAQVREYEKQIDQLVYKLYGLTTEEIKIVEQSK